MRPMSRVCCGDHLVIGGRLGPMAWHQGTAPCWSHHSYLEAHPRLPQQVLLGNATVLKDEVGRGRSSDAQLIFLLPQCEPRRWHGNQESTDALEGPERPLRGSSEAVGASKLLQPHFANTTPDDSSRVSPTSLLLLAWGEGADSRGTRRSNSAPEQNSTKVLI
jgi:hypothetical protein